MKRKSCFLLLAIILLGGACVLAQEQLPYRRTAVSFNITRLMVNEANMGFERFITNRRSFDFEFGVMYANEFWQEAAKSYTTDPLFHEHGFAARFHYKFFRTKDNSKWRNFMGPGISYKHLYYNDYDMAIDKKDEAGRAYVLTLKQDRERDKFGIDFIWGNAYEASRTFAFEFYYGAGLSITSVKRSDHDRYVTYVDEYDQSRNTALPNYIDHSVYLRPVIQLGMKLVIRL